MVSERAARWSFVALLSCASFVGCREEERPASTPPPPAAAAKPGACTSGGGQIGDAATAAFFSRTSGGFCLDPNGKEKTFGDGASMPLDQICDLFDGECEVYKRHNVRRVVEVRYVDGAGTPATIDIYLSKFATTDGAYAMFTKRVVGDGDPAAEERFRKIDGGGVAVLGEGSAYLWRGQYLAEITYNDENASAASAKDAGDRLLPPFVREMGAKLPGETELPAAAAALPRESQVALGVRYVTTDLLDVEGVGGGAAGYYKEGDRRWRVLSLVRADSDQAKDALATFAKVAGAAKEKGIGEGAVRFVQKEPDGEPVEWIVARSGKSVVGVGDEPRVLRRGMSADDRGKVTLGKDEKIAKLKKALAQP